MKLPSSTIMTLPVLTSVEDCANYHKTVEPFMPQLYALPHKLAGAAASLDALKQVYVETNPLVSAFGFSLFLGGVFLVASEVNRNYSQVDRMWSILPNLYIVHLAVWARAAGLAHERIDLVAAFSTLWSVRLTFNYWRRGGYQIGSEDYRWSIIKSHIPFPVWFVFNVVFISFIQSVLLFAFSCVPAYAILLSSRFEPEVKAADWAFLAVQVSLVISEWISDGQQYAYQTSKHQYYKSGRIAPGYTETDFDRGFNTHGLWSVSRHPNFFAEQTIWLALYQWSCYATNTLFSWTFTGAGCLLLLFQGSTMLTEWITGGKYTEYKEYQRQVGMFIPLSVGYTPPAKKGPTIIKTSELAKRQAGKK